MSSFIVNPLVALFVIWVSLEAVDGSITPLGLTYQVMMSSSLQENLKVVVQGIRDADAQISVSLPLYPGMLDAQLVGADHFKFIRCTYQDEEFFHVDTHVKSPDDVFVGLDIKYLNDCKYRLDPSFNAERFLHPIAHEFAFMKVLEGKDVAPSVYLLSEPTLDSGALKQQYFHSGVKHMIDRRFSYLRLPEPSDCERVRSTTRFLTYEDIGISVLTFYDYNSHRFKTEVKRLKSIINMGTKALKLVSRLHSFGVIHGNINGGSIRFAEAKDDWSAYRFKNDRLLLVDFHEAFLISDLPPVGNYNPVDSPPWHLDGNTKRGMRDDVYAVAELLARLISEGKLTEDLMRADSEKDIKAVRHVKETFELFPHKGLFGGTRLGSERFVIADEFLKIVRKMGENEVPPYDELIDKLNKIKEILSKEGNGIFSTLFG